MTDDFFDKSKGEAKTDENERFPAWNWTDSPEFRGTFDGLKIQPIKGGEIKFLMSVTQHGTGDKFVIWLGDTPRVLRNEVGDAAPAVGSLMYIEYQGEHPTQDGMYKFKKFFVKVDQADQKYWRDKEIELSRKRAAGFSNVTDGELEAKTPNFGPDESPF